MQKKLDFRKQVKELDHYVQLTRAMDTMAESTAPCLFLKRKVIFIAILAFKCETVFSFFSLVTQTLLV
jgi:hypothetical protein